MLANKNSSSNRVTAHGGKIILVLYLHWFIVLRRGGGGPETNGKMWETKGERGKRKGKVGEGGRNKTKQENRTR